MLRITDENALLIKVNRHNKKYDGTICTNPLTYNCGAKEFHRRNYCAQGYDKCMDMHLFDSKGAYVKKLFESHHRRIFEDLQNTISEGFSPIVFFYTEKSARTVYNPRMNRQYYIVGAYVLKEVNILTNGRDTDQSEVQLIADSFIRLPFDTLSNDELWHQSNELPDTIWFREVYKAVVIPTLENMQKVLQQSDPNDFSQYLSLAEKYLFELSGVPEAEYIEEAKALAKPLEKQIPVDVSPASVVVANEQLSDALVVNSQKERFDELVTKILEVASERGFYYSPDVVRNIVSSLTINPLLILSGISGSGKSSFAMFYTESIEGELSIIAVRPDWTSPSHLLGVYSPFAEEFIATPTADFIRKAGEEWEKAKQEKRTPKSYVLLLDEMNLARVEYYFSDFLSKMQFSDEENRYIELYHEKEGKYPSKLLLPQNLKIIGTVNVDETTFLFSPKVLDRASYIKLNEIDIDSMGKVIDKRAEEIHHIDIIRRDVLPELRDLNYKLAEFGQAFGYRTVWDIVRWIDFSLSVGNVKNVFDGLDLQVESRILVKLVDSRRAILPSNLKAYFEDRNSRHKDSEDKYKRCIQRLEILISRSMRDEYAGGQQY